MRVVLMVLAALLLAAPLQAAERKIGYQLTLIFADGYMGGRYPVALFHDKSACETKGAAQAAEFGGFGHPASFICPAYDLNRKIKPGEGPTHVEYKLPTGPGDMP